MDVMECIRTRRSGRVYEDRPISEEDMKILLDCGVKAPNGSGMEPWAFVVINGREEIDEWSEKIKDYIREHMEDYPYLKQYESWMNNPKFSVFNRASTVIAICGNRESHWRVYDCSLAAGNIMLAAHSMGIGTCWIGFAEYMFNTKEFKERYRIPEEYDVICPMSLGYRKVEQKPPVRKEPVILNALM